MSFVCFAPHHILINYETLEPNWPSSMDSSRAYTNLRAETIPKTVRKARARIDECTRRIHTSTKDRCCLFRFGDNGICMVRRMSVYELDRSVNRR